MACRSSQTRSFVRPLSKVSYVVVYGFVSFFHPRAVMLVCLLALVVVVA